MKTIKVIIFTFAAVILLAAFSNAQDHKSGHDHKSKDTMTKEKSGCGEMTSSCCETGEKTASTVKPWNEVCPVLGNKVSPTTRTVEYEGKIYGFCCPGCDDKFAKDPEAYMNNLSKDGKTYIRNKS